MEVGKPCSYKECCATEFLPATCPFCKLPFCFSHRTADEHQCTEKPEEEKAAIIRRKRRRCQNVAEKEQCRKKLDHSPQACSYCSMFFCLSHRFPEFHDCTDFLDLMFIKRMYV